MPSMYVLDVEEFACVVEAAKANPEYTVTDLGKGYIHIESPTELAFNRKEMKMKPALWYGIFTAGMDGQIVEFGREWVRLVNADVNLSSGDD